LSQFIIESIASQTPVGLVACYNARTDLGWVYFAYTRVSAASKPVGSEMLEGGLLFISFLFRNWNFRKLYAEVPGWNWGQFTKGAGEFFTQEGVLLEHEFFDGRYWDQHILPFHRRAWETKTALLVDILCPPEPSA
jgi:RimJ/RimL family protein N-acetyltransferase